VSAEVVSHGIATAGQHGHGKSALIHALTGAEPDQRAADGPGVTAGQGPDLLTLPSGTRLAIADLPPAPARLVSTLMAGTGPVPAVMFVVAADEGWMQQSAEHAALVSTLDIRHGLLVVTKSDLADPARVLTEASARLAQSTLGDVRAVAVSSVTRAGLPELVGALDELCARLPAPDPGAAVRVWIDRAVVGPDNGSTVVTGMLPAGTVHTHDELLITPAMRPVRVSELHTPGDLPYAAAGTTRVALTVRGVGADELHRGMALIQPGRWTLTDVIDARVRQLRPVPDGGMGVPGQREEAAPGQLARTVTLHIGSARVVARVRPLGSGVARLTLAEPLPLHAGERVLLREYGTRQTGSPPAMAGSIVLDVAPPPLTRRGAAAAAARQLAAWPDRPTAAELLARHGLMRASALLAMGVPELPRPVAGEWLADSERWRALGHQLGEVLAGHAAVEPLTAGLPVEAARAALDLPDRRLVAALARPPFRISAGAVQIAPAGPQPGSTLPEATLPEPGMAAVRVLRADLEVAPFVSPDANRLRKLGLDADGIAAAVRAGELMRISEHVVLAPGADVAAAQILARLEQPFTAAQARQALCTTRRTVIPLLEFLDAAGLTERLADDRRLVRAAAGPAAARDEQPSLVAGEPGR
jgi:selenocysteine-specific elongation factor